MGGETILNHYKDEQGDIMYEVQWKGWDDTTWEPETYLDQCGGLISKYWASKERKIIKIEFVIIIMIQ